MVYIFYSDVLVVYDLALYYRKYIIKIPRPNVQRKRNIYFILINSSSLL